ncbi:unnamed protein product [Rhizophagus irregularis]|nr:unnamed protein product [Rhizophagus irregularis]
MEPLRTNNNIVKNHTNVVLHVGEQGKKAYQQRKQQTNAETGNQISIELNELYEFLPEILDALEKKNLKIKKI